MANNMIRYIEGFVCLNLYRKAYGILKSWMNNRN